MAVKKGSAKATSTAKKAKKPVKEKTLSAAKKLPALTNLR
jgi:hypothetical protein